MSALHASILISLLAFAVLFYRSKMMRRAKKLLQQAKQEAKNIAELSLNNPHPVMQISEDLQVQYMNTSALALFPDLKEKGEAHNVLHDIDSLFHKEETGRDIFHQGKYFYQVVKPIRQGGSVAYVIYCSDVTALKEKEEALRAANKKAEYLKREAEAANKARGDFLANMSHELRTPMNGIIGLSEMLSDSDLSYEKKEMAEAVHSSAKGLLILLNDILDFSKIEAGELKIESVACDMRQLCEQLQRLHLSVARDKGIELLINIDENVPQQIVSDPTRLQQILNNLISNAIKFTHEGRVVVSLRADNKATLQIEVEDSGIGIPKDKQIKVFEKFSQAESDTARKYGGTGLGLTITKQLVDKMGGIIGIESEEGVGTTFSLSLPYEIMSRAEIAICQQEQNGSEDTAKILNTRACLLVVDDHPVNLLFMRKTLSKMGFQDFKEARSGIEAIQFFQEEPFDLILMDCQMPEMDGFEATRNIREMENVEQEPVIIAVTADAMKGVAEKCAKAGMDDYISKPVDSERLKELFLEWLPEAEQDLSSEQKEGNIMNWQHFSDFTDGNQEMEQELLQIFIENLQQDLKALHQCYTNKDFQGWEEAAHKLYGASAHVGAICLADVCSQAESLDLANPAPIKQMHYNIGSNPIKVRNYQ